MDEFSIWHGIILLILFSYIIPTWRIVRRAGYPGAWSLLSFIPVLNVIMLWVFAYSDWPRKRV
jgi:hypothetical protein